jgi:thiamine biosynthesis lipoprotein
MTKRRLLTLLGGVCALSLFSFYRLRGEATAPEKLHGDFSPVDAHLPRLATFSGKSMGTTYSVKFVPQEGVAEEKAQLAVETALRGVNQAMSTYDPTSEISRLNRSKTGGPLTVSEPFAEVMKVSVDVHAATDGAFDVTVGPLVRVYGFGPDEERALPPATTLATIAESVGLLHVRFDEKARTVQKLKDGVELDFSGVAKGYGVDRAARALEELGIVHYMVEVGGEIRVRGEKKPKTPWLLAIEEPLTGERRIHGTLSLPSSGGALATSGDYRNFRNIAGQLVSHTFDPRTKRPVPRRTASVSVVRSTAAEADAIATAMNVLEPKRALEIANQRGFAVYLLIHKAGGGFEARKSREFEKLAFERP